MSEPSFDELLQRLVGEGAQFVLIGGFALNAWGVVRGTKDVDIVVDPEAENLSAVARVAASLNGHVQRPDALAGSVLCAELRSRAVEVEVGDAAVWVCALEDLRAMKRAAGRTRDIADLEDLDAAHGAG